MTVGNAIRRHFVKPLSRVASFSGRDRSEDFWRYFAVIFVMMSCVTSIVGSAIVKRGIGAMQQFGRMHPEQVTISQGPGYYSIQTSGAFPGLLPHFHGLIIAIAFAAFIMVVLIAAAVVRRLHDCDWSGWWALVPLPFLVCGFVLMGRMLAMTGEPTTGLPGATLIPWLMANNLAYLGLIVALGIQLSRDGTAGPNRFGPAPLER